MQDPTSNVPSPLLKSHDVPAMGAFLQDADVLRPGERVVSVTRAGEGNMNCTLRVTTGDRTLIVKQSRPWVEKYPQFAAPADRIHREMDFHALASLVPELRRRMPEVLRADREAFAMVMEDMGTGADYTGIFRDEPWADEDVKSLADFLGVLHSRFWRHPALEGLTNREMRRLNADHIFFIPLRRSNGLNLDGIQPGLEALGDRLKQDDRLVAEIARLGQEIYLADGPCLVHGDFFPGSILRSSRGPCIIDFEFCFAGRPEFDTGVLVAHLALAGQVTRVLPRFLDRYRPACPHEESLMLQLAGVEIVRRLIGYAQLPLQLSIAEKRMLLETARELVMQPDRSVLRQLT